MSLSLDDIGYTYGRVATAATKALDGVSLTVAPGELVLVLGATGSGKSTFLRVAAGLLEPDCGAVALDDEPLTRATARGVVALVFQDAESQLFADTVIDDVAFGPTNLGASPDEAVSAAREALRSVGLDPEEFGGRSPFALSGGEARRAAIAGVIAMSPRYLLADEPTAGLDAHGRSAVRELLLDLRERAGIVVVSHSAEEFLEHADRVLVLDSGCSSWSGSASSVVNDPSPLIRAGLIAPDVLEVMRIARERGAYSGAFTLDAEEAARRLAEAGGWRV